MKKLSAITGLCAITVGIALTGCSATATKDKATETKAETSASPTKLGVSEAPTGTHKTIADYVDENKIVETAVKPGDADSPKFVFAMPPDWRKAGNQKPDWAYGAIVYTKAEDPADPPFMTSIVSKLTGDVDPAKVLEYAPGLLNNLPGYQQNGDIKKTTLSGFDAIKFQGSYLRDSERRYIAQETVIIPAPGGGLFVLQLNADAPEGQEEVVHEAAKVINRDSKISV